MFPCSNTKAQFTLLPKEALIKSATPGMQRGTTAEKSRMDLFSVSPKQPVNAFMVWKPHVTVAAVIEQDNRFLLVEESTDNGLSFNQPAGHLEAGETILDAIRREVREETAWQFEPETLIAVQLWRRNMDSPSFVRFCFSGHIYNHSPNQALDDEIIATHWLSRNEIVARAERLRSPLVLKSVDAYLSGQRYPLTLLQSFLDLA